MAYKVTFLPRVDREMDRLPHPMQIRIIHAVNALAENPRPSGCKKLAVDNLWRIRIGNYRAIYEIHDDRLIVLVLRVAHRKIVYRGL